MHHVDEAKHKNYSYLKFFEKSDCFLFSHPVSTSDTVLQLLVDSSEAIDTLSNSSVILFPAILSASATIPMTPAMTSMVITKIGTKLFL